MNITIRQLMIIGISSLAIACAPKEPVKYLALSFDDGLTMYSVVPDGRK